MHALDIVFLVLAVVLVVIGARRGIIVEAFRLIAVAAGFGAAATFYRPLAERLHILHLSAGATVVLSFLVVFVVAVLAVVAVGWVAKKAVHMTVLGWVDRLGGAVLGAAKCCLIAWVFTLAVAALPIEAAHRNLEKAVVYSLCRRLPMQLALPAALEVKRSIQGVVSQEPIADLPGRFVEFRARVDSVKGNLP